MHYRRAQNLRNRFRAFDFCDLGVTVLKAIPHAMPYQFVHGELLREFYVLPPISFAFRDLDAPFRASDHLVFWIQNLYYQLTCTGVGSVVGKGQVQYAVGIGCAGSGVSAGRLKLLNRYNCGDQQ